MAPKRRSAEASSSSNAKSARTQRGLNRPLLNSSGISATERRELRIKERNMYHEIRDKENELTKIQSTTFHTKAQELDDIYVKVHYPREANLDATNLDQFSNVIGKQAEQLSASDLSKFDMNIFIKSSRSKYATEDQKFDWKIMGTGVAGCFRSVPQCNFLYGAMDTEVKVRVRQQTKRIHVRDDAEEAQPKEYTDFQRGRVDAQARRLKVMNDCLPNNSSVDMFKLTINPISFTQTVENLFDLSFLIRNGEVKLEVSKETNLPTVTKRDEDLGDFDYSVASQQCVISLTPHEYQQIIENWQITEPMVGHRRQE